MLKELVVNNRIGTTRAVSSILLCFCFIILFSLRVQAEDPDWRATENRQFFTTATGDEDNIIPLGLSDNGVLTSGGPIRDVVDTGIGYRPKSSGSAVNSFTIPANVTEARITAFATNSDGSSSIDEDIQLATIEVDLTENTSMGQMMLTTGASTWEDMNFAWFDAPLNDSLLHGGADIVGNTHTEYNDLWIGVSGGQITISQTQSTLNTTYFVEWLDATNSSLSSLGADYAYFAPDDTSNSVSVPSGTDLVIATSQSGRLVNGTWREDPATLSRIILNLDSNTATGFVGVSNGSKNSDSMGYAFTGYDISSATAGGVLSSGATISGDASADGLGTESPNLFVSNGSLFVERLNNEFASQFGTLYTFEFYDRKPAGSPAVGLGGSADYTIVRPIVDMIDLNFPVPASAKSGMLTIYQIDPNANNTINENKGIFQAFIDIDNRTSSGSFQFIRAQVPDLLSWGNAPMDGTILMEHGDKVSSNALLDANNVQTARLELASDDSNLRFLSTSHSSNYFSNSGSQRNLNVVGQVQWFGYTPFIVDMREAPNGTSLTSGQHIGNDLYEIDPSDIATLGLIPSPNFNGSFNITSTFNFVDEVKTVTLNSVDDDPTMADVALNANTIPGETIAAIMRRSVSSPTAISSVAIDGYAGDGTWQYSTNNGQTWNDIGSVSGSSALLLRSIDRVRFVPNSTGSATFTYHMWDEGAGSAGSKVDLASTSNAKFAAVEDTVTLGVWNFVDPNASDLSLMLRLSRSGGIEHPLNVIGDTANGIDICPSDPTPGCDFDDNPGHNDNGTVLDPWDDTYTGDIKVRSNDSAEIIFYYNTPNNSSPVHITSTLPIGLSWSFLPGYCLDSGSGLSGDGHHEASTLTCNVDTSLRGLAGELPAYVTVFGSKTSGTLHSISADYSNGVTVETSNSIQIETTSTPRFNLKYQMDGVAGKTLNGVDGRTVDFHYYIETHNGNSTTNPYYGNEQSGSSIVLDMTAIASGAILIDCYNPTSANWARFPYAGDPPNYTTPAAMSFVQAGDASCTQANTGDGVQVTLTNVDTSLRWAPEADRRGATYRAATTKVATAGVVRLFVPLADIQAAPNGQLAFTTCATQSGVTGISGAANFLTGTEDLSDNCVSHVMKVDAASFSTGYSGQAGSSLWTGSFPGTATARWSGDGVVIPNETFAAELYIQNDGSQPLTNVVMCNIFDNDTYKVVDLGAGVATSILAPAYTDGVTIEYAAGYVAGSWPPALSPDRDSVTAECGDPSVVWYPSLTAVPGGADAVTKVRVSLTGDLPVAANMSAWTQLMAMENGNPSGTILPLMGTAKTDGVWEDDWYPCDYDKGVYPGEHQPNGLCGDRVMLNFARATVQLKTWNEDSAESLALNSQMGFEVYPDFTAYEDNFYSTVIITTHLPAEVAYEYGSAVQGTTRSATALEPVVIPNATLGGTDLVWDLGTLQANQAIEPIHLKVRGMPGMQTGQDIKLTSSVYSPASSDTTAPGSKDTREVVGIVQQKLYLGMNTPNMFAQPGEPITFTSTIYNGRYLETLTGIDYISALPFIGDQRSPASDYDGTLTLASVTSQSGDYQLYYSADAGGSIDPIASADSNDFSTGSTNWCLANGDGSVDAAASPTNGGAGACPTTLADVKAYRIVDNEGLSWVEGARSRVITTTLNTSSNLNGNIYTARAAVTSNEFVQPAFSNDYPVIVVSPEFSGQLWFDLNGNGSQDDGELGIADVEFWLVQIGGSTRSNNATVQSATTDANGNYTFAFPDGLPLGQYGIAINPASIPEDLVQTFDIANGTLGDGTPKATPINLNAPQRKSNINFGFQGSGSIRGFVWADEDGNGSLAENESGIADVPVMLVDSSGNQMNYRTDENGYFLFDGLPSATYTITIDSEMIAPAINSFDPDAVRDGKTTVQLAGSQTEDGINFGFQSSPEGVTAIQSKAMSAHGATSSMLILLMVTLLIGTFGAIVIYRPKINR